MTRQAKSTKTASSSGRKSPAPMPRKADQAKAVSKLDQLAAMLARRQGASIAEMVEVTGWQPHSVRGALAGALKRRGLVITSEKTNSFRRYRSGIVQ